ncbi:hypothetical protein F2P79_013370, partial [Pimephales promelas]
GRKKQCHSGDHHIWAGSHMIKEHCLKLLCVKKRCCCKKKAAVPEVADGPLHSIRPGDFVVIKDFRRKHWRQKRWQGPYQVLLVTHTAVKVAEKVPWIHGTHCRKSAGAINGRAIPHTAREFENSEQLDWGCSIADFSIQQNSHWPKDEELCLNDPSILGVVQRHAKELYSFNGEGEAVTFPSITTRPGLRPLIYRTTGTFDFEQQHFLAWHGNVGDVETDGVIEEWK